MSPPFRCHVGRVDAELLDRGNGGEGAANARPALEPQQAIAAGRHARNGRHALAEAPGAHDVESGEDRAVLVRLPTDGRKELSRGESDDAPAAVEDALVLLRAEGQPVLDPAR